MFEALETIQNQVESLTEMLLQTGRGLNLLTVEKGLIVFSY